jgi:hypothetical protein
MSCIHNELVAFIGPESRKTNGFIKIFTSELFAFKVGEHEGHIMIHSHAIARLSPSLNTLINRLMREA